jgi:hypothetical protein
MAKTNGKNNSGRGKKMTLSKNENPRIAGTIEGGNRKFCFSYDTRLADSSPPHHVSIYIKLALAQLEKSRFNNLIHAML